MSGDSSHNLASLGWRSAFFALLRNSAVVSGPTHTNKLADANYGSSAAGDQRNRPSNPRACPTNLPRFLAFKNSVNEWRPNDKSEHFERPSSDRAKTESRNI